jgi:hemoglobin-like flavoprotein
MTEPAMTFSAAEEALLKRSFAKISADPRSASRIFYEHLFQSAPETRDLFLNDMARQGDKLIATLSVVILQIGNLTALKPTIEELGLRHVAYGVLPEHYPATGAALIRMLEDVLQDSFSAEMRAAWGKAYAAISHIMVVAVENRKTDNRVVGDFGDSAEEFGA